MVPAIDRIGRLPSDDDEEDEGEGIPAAKKRPRATPKKTARKSSSKRSGHSPSRSPSAGDSSPNLEHGTWADIARLEEDDERPPTVFGLIPFSPEPEGGKDAVMDNVDELAGSECPQGPSLRPSEPDRQLSVMSVRSEVSPVKSEVEEAAIPPPRVVTARSSIKAERMSPSVLFSPDSPPSAPLPVVKAPRSRSSSPASDASSDPAGLSALVPSPRQSASMTVEPPVAQRGSVESLLDRLAQSSTPFFVPSSQPLRPQPTSVWSHEAAQNEASTSRQPALLPPRATKAHFRVIAPPPSDSETASLNVTTPVPPTSVSRVGSEAVTPPLTASAPAEERTSKKRSRDESVDADEAAVTAKREDLTGEVPSGPSAEERAQVKAGKKARKAERAIRRETKRQKQEVAAVPSEASVRPLPESPPSSPSTDPASASTADRTALVRSKLQQWVGVRTQPEKVGRAIIAWLGEYPMSGLRMLLLKELFTQLLDLNVVKARPLCWSVICLSEQTPGLLTDPPRNSFQRWLLQDIREADRTLYTSRIPIYSELFALNPPYSYKTCLDQHLARLTRPSAPDAADLEAFRTLLATRLTALEKYDLLAPAFLKLRALAASPHLAPDARTALERLLLLDPRRPPAPKPPAPIGSDERSVVIRRCLDKLDELDERREGKLKRHAQRVSKALMGWLKDAHRPLHAPQAPETACLVTLALDRAHRFFLGPEVTRIFFKWASLGVHKAVCDAIVTSDQASYTSRIPVFAKMLAATKNGAFAKAYVDGHLRRLLFYPRPPQDVIANLIDVVRPAGAALDKNGLLDDVFAAFRKLRDEDKLEIGGKMLINDLIYLRKSNWKTVPR